MAKTGLLATQRLDDDDLAAQIAFLERELVRLRSAQRDRDDARLVRAIFQAIGAAVFDTYDAFDAATLHPALQRVLKGLTRNQLGRRLKRVTNRSVGGLIVQLVTRKERGRVYVITPRQPDASLE